jgi:hypothetical protein
MYLGFRIELAFLAIRKLICNLLAVEVGVIFSR